MFSIRSDKRIYRRKIQQEPTIEWGVIENDREDNTEAEELRVCFSGSFVSSL
jgi:hypothetical protein